MRNGIFFVKRMPPVLSLSNFYGAGPANVHIESTGPGLCAIHRSSWNRYSRKSACRIMHSPGPTPRGHACPDLRTKGDTDRGSPFPLQASIKAHAPCEENAHSRRRQRLVGALQFRCRAGLASPPSEAARLFSCPNAPVLCDGVYYVQNRKQDGLAYIRIR